MPHDTPPPTARSGPLYGFICLYILLIPAALAIRSQHDPDAIRIAFILKTMQEERYQQDRRDFTERASEQGVTVLFSSCNNNELDQLNNVENMITMGAKVIVIQPVNSGTAAKILEMCKAEGVRVVGYDTMILNGPMDAMVMQDSWAVGKLQGEAMLAWFTKRRGAVAGKVALIMGEPGDSNAIAMSSGAKQIIEQNKGLELVAEQSHVGWATDKAMATTQDVLTRNLNKVDAFICNNSGLARGVIAALAEQGLDNTDKVFVAGSDADLVNIQFVAQGKQTVEIWKKVKPLARTAADVAVLLAKNPDRPVDSLVKPNRMVDNGYARIRTILTPVVLVDRDNLRETVIAGKLYTAKQVYER